MAAAKAKSGGLDALLETAEPAFVAPSPVESAEEPQFRTVAERMTIAPEPVVEPAPEPIGVIAEPPEEQTPTPPAERPVKVGIPTGWHEMEGAPEDGKPVFLLGPDDPPDSRDHQYVEAVYRHSRAYDKNGGRWRPIGFWAVRNCAGIKVPWTPIAWRPAL
jgi:hypothetical protein